MPENPKHLRNQREQQLGVWLPFPLSQHIDDLCDSVGRTSAGIVRRKELVAALIFAAEQDPRELANLIAIYREAPAWDRTFARRKPGPRVGEA